MLRLQFHQERTGEHRGTWNDVLLFGKKVAEQSWGADGHGAYWILSAASIRLRIRNPKEILKSVFKDLSYAVKVIRSVRSGYSCLEYRCRDEWEPIGYTMEPVDCGGGRALYLNFSLGDQPYYVCARFGNGRHIPLPLVLGDDGDAGPLQRLALKVASKFSKAMRESEYDCATYHNQFENAQAGEQRDIFGAARDFCPECQQTLAHGYSLNSKFRAGDFVPQQYSAAMACYGCRIVWSVAGHASL